MQTLHIKKFPSVNVQKGTAFFSFFHFSFFHFLPFDLGDLAKEACLLHREEAGKKGEKFFSFVSFLKNGEGWVGANLL